MNKIQGELFGNNKREYSGVNIIQFLPYFPPHKGGLETVSEELSSFYVAKGYGDVKNVVFSVGQEKGVFEYEKNGYKVYVIPAFDIISNFPVPKFWKKEFWEILKNINPSLTLPLKIKEGKENWIIQTHTRFFLSSFLGGLFAKYHKLKWVHIEHGSDYVKLGSKFKSKISYIYDRLIGKWIFKKADKIVAISEGVKEFIVKEFINREIDVIYNGINFNPKERIENGNLIKIGFIGRLVKLKGVDLLLEVFENLSKKYENIILEIVGDGDEKQNLEKYILKNNIENIKFLGFQNREYIANNFLPQIDILVNPSYQEGLPTTVLEGLLSKCVVIATDVGGTKEISNLDDLIIIESGNILELEKGLEKAILNYKEIRGKSSEIVKEKFDWNENIGKYFSLYNEI